ncbi:MAG TPA: uroporphyrinogen-III synthase, partial [Gammaproteobacteria bacterium]
IEDASDAEPVNGWLRRYIESPFDDFIILTGEGIRRLRGFAARMGVEAQWIESLRRMRKLARGPKPGRALQEIGLKPELQAVEPTTAGIIATLSGLELKGRRMAVQLYGEDPNEKLMTYLSGRGIKPDTVAPYRYASESDDSQVEDMIKLLIAGEIDAIAFTSSSQYQRLAEVAAKTGLREQLLLGLGKTIVAAVGPVVAATIQADGVRVDMMPEESFFMKPMVSKLSGIFSAGEDTK